MNDEQTEITLEETIQEFSKNAMKGFQRVLLIGLGIRLGIIDYFFEKVKDSVGPVEYVSFTPEELSTNLKLDPNYLDAWLQLSLELNIFEIEAPKQKRLRTAPYIYDLFINKNNQFNNLRNLYGWTYKLAPMQNLIFQNFSTGQFIERSEISAIKEVGSKTQRLGVREKRIKYAIFSKKYKEYRKILNNGGKILSIGCGYGFGIELLAKKYKKAFLTGIDINKEAINYCQQTIKENNWEDRVSVSKISLDEFFKSCKKNEFDLVVLSEVLHELTPDEEYRRSVISNIYEILKKDGLLVIFESCIPELFEHERDKVFWHIVKKWDEVSMGAKFYNQETMKELVLSTPFQNLEYLTDDIVSFWVAKK